MRGECDGWVSTHNYTVSQPTGILSTAAAHWRSGHTLFMTKGVVLESLVPSQFAKSRNSHKRGIERQVEVGLLEAQVYRYAELLEVSGGVCDGVGV